MSRHTCIYVLVTKRFWPTPQTSHSVECDMWVLGLPLNAWIMARRVSREIPLCPLARTLILRASSMRVLSGLSGFPTPTCVHHANKSMFGFTYCATFITCDEKILKKKNGRWAVSLQQGFYLLSVSAPGSPAALCGTTKQHMMDRQVHEEHLIFFFPTVEWLYFSLLTGITVRANLPKPVVIP